MGHKHIQTRREFLNKASIVSAGAGIGSFILPKMLLGGTSLGHQEDFHYFLHINIPGGFDANYLFDSRPLEMNSKGLITNYHGKEPILYTGSNGQKTLRTSLTDNLMKWSNNFSIINGVVMSDTFQGHDQVANIMLTGNPFGGESFLPWINTKSKPLDFVQSGFIFSNQTNSGGGINMSPQVCKDLASKILEINKKNDAMNYIKSSTDRIQGTKSSLANSARNLGRSIDALPAFATKLSSIDLKIETPSPEATPREKILAKTKSEIQMMTELMKNGVTDVGVIAINLNIDIHDGDTASKFPSTVQDIVDSLAIVFEHLSSTPSNSGNSFLDDTTIFIGSEFSRTMRQTGVDIHKSGTDHNSLCNTFILGGKGVKGGLVLGESDFSNGDETLSSTHTTLDPAKVMVMGRPFDFGRGVSSTALPTQYNPTHYITSQSVVNTLQRILNIPDSKSFTLGRNLPKASVLPWLIS